MEIRNKECLYRCDDVHYEHRTEIHLSTFDVTKRTEKGAWIKMHPWHDHATKFVLLTARKQYACETKDEAMVSFIARKNRQKRILTAQLQRVERALNKAEGIEPAPLLSGLGWG